MSEHLKCGVCNKSIKTLESVTGKCKCGNTYCTQHRYPETHKCSFNHKELGRNILLDKATKMTYPKVIESH